MQAFKNHLLKKSQNFYKTKVATVANWTSNSMTGEAFTRHLAGSNNYINGWSVFNRPNLKVKARVQYNQSAKPDQTKDFPGVSQKIAFLTGNTKKI
jgi:hypothetical protein